MGDHDKAQGQMGQNQSGGQNKGTTQVGTHGNQGPGQTQGTGLDDRSQGDMYGEQGRQNQGQPNPQSQGNVGNTTKEPMRDPQTSSTTRPTNQKR
jgi:hypothetical protein